MLTDGESLRTKTLVLEVGPSAKIHGCAVEVKSNPPLLHCVQLEHLALTDRIPFEPPLLLLLLDRT